MSQTKILEVLEGCDEWVDTGFLSKKTGLRRNTVNQSLQGLFKYGFVVRKQGYGNQYLYKV